MEKKITVVRDSENQKQDFEWGQLTWYASRDLGNSDDMTVGRCLLKPGQANPRHHHPNCSEALVVTRGRVKHTTADGGETELAAGDAVIIPPNIKHQARNTGGEDAVLFIAFSAPDRQTVGE